MFSRRGILLLSLTLLHSEAMLAQPAHDARLLNFKSHYFHDLRPFAAFTVGPEFIHTNHSQTLSLLPPFSNHYTSNSSWQSSANLGLAAGFEKALTHRLRYQLGLAGYFNTEVHPQGHVLQLALPEFDNFTYRYQIQSSRLMATGKLLGTVKQTLHPYLSAELGAAFNHAQGYNEMPLREEAVAMAPFSNHTNTSFSWGAGLGLDVDINANLRLGAGYQFIGLGKAQLGLSPAQETSQVLTTPHLYSHQLRFQLTALI
jgi:opacity protein-like surface antigen